MPSPPRSPRRRRAHSKKKRTQKSPLRGRLQDAKYSVKHKLRPPPTVTFRAGSIPSDSALDVKALLLRHNAMDEDGETLTVRNLSADQAKQLLPKLTAAFVDASPASQAQDSIGRLINFVLQAQVAAALERLAPR